MSSALCCKSCCRHLLRLLFVLLCIVLLMPKSCSGGRISRSAFLDDNAQVRSVVVDPNNRTIWNMFNLTDAQVRFIQNRTNPNNQDETTQTSSHRHLQHVASRRVNEIFNLIRNAVTNQSDGTTNRDSLGATATQTHGQKTLHEKAGFPICNAETSILNWQQSTNVTLQFASSIFQRSAGDSLSLDSALLRLYKIDPNNKSAAEPTATAETTICPEPELLDSQIRVTVSIVHQQKKKRKLERKKRTCNTVMLSSSKIGWVDIDVKCALNYWEQQQCQHSHSPLPASVVGMLMIEVHDDEENQLKPGLYFEQPKCDQILQSHGPYTEQKRLCLVWKTARCPDTQG
ncbi:protein anachronism isoform X3 [Drosophila willistoni]|uniref:protein anachronism isoform X3 n=1 Tax=Drosophila willistoni TaxID=7260 RepID=UPI001F082E3A|nr:protein anachronism isoform X3 [Drosophila willistoni]